MRNRALTMHPCRNVALLSAFFLAGGCSNLAPPSADVVEQHAPRHETEPAWNPFILNPGDHFKYEYIDHTHGNGKGWVAINIKSKNEAELEAQWEGEFAGKHFSITTSAKPERLIELSRPQLFSAAPVAPFLATVLSSWWEPMRGFHWRPGSEWTTALREFSSGGFTVKVAGRCEAGGVHGYHGQLLTRGHEFASACVDPQVPLPLSVLTKDNEGKPRFEAKLIKRGA